MNKNVAQQQSGEEEDKKGVMCGAWGRESRSLLERREKYTLGFRARAAY
jgi:hypothetical protein